MGNAKKISASARLDRDTVLEYHCSRSKQVLEAHRS